VENKAPILRADVEQAASLLGVSRALVYKRIAAGAIHAQKDGKRTFISMTELARYVESLECSTRRASPEQAA
jgi:excisionase family DNA binding protein